MDMENTDNPEVLAVVPLPSATERRRREVMLARLMLLAIDTILAGEPLGLERACDLSRELRNAYPELWTFRRWRRTRRIVSPSLVAQ